MPAVAFHVETRIHAKWCSIHPTNGAPYIFESCAEADRMRRMMCHPESRVVADVTFGNSIFSIPLSNWESATHED